MATRAIDTQLGEMDLNAGRSGRIDRIIAWLEQLPVPAIVWLAVVFLAWELLLNGSMWLTGAMPVAELDINLSFAPVIGTYALVLILVLDRIAAVCLRDFEPALGEAPEARRLAFELRRTPDAGATVVVLALIVLITLGYLWDPVGGREVLSLPPAGIAISLLGYWTAFVVLGVLILRTLRQLRLVSRLHAVAENIDLFNATAINALSRLTAATAVGFLIFAAPFFINISEAQGQGTVFGPVSIAAFVVLAIASFVLPLRGMHDRMVAEKRRLLGSSAERLKLTVQRVHGTVDADDMHRADELQKTMSSLLSEREVVAKLSTWPWSTGTFRGFASAVVLPIVIWLVIRVLERLV